MTTHNSVTAESKHTNTQDGVAKRKHTPTPWIVRTGKLSQFGQEHIWICAPGTITGRTIAGPVPRDILQDEDYPEKLADAELIVTAVNEREALLNTCAEYRRLLTAAGHALRSYQFGNGSPDLAKMQADQIDAALTAAQSDGGA